MSERAKCQECGWEGDWRDVWVELPSGRIGPDPGLKYTDPPYFCPECEEAIEGEED
jgi:hypothetical protein